MGPSVSDGSPLDSKIGYAGDEFGEDRVRKLGVLFLFQHSPDIHELVFGWSQAERSSKIIPKEGVGATIIKEGVGRDLNREDAENMNMCGEICAWAPIKRCKTPLFY